MNWQILFASLGIFFMFIAGLFYFKQGLIKIGILSCMYAICNTLVFLVN